MTTGLWNVGNFTNGNPNIILSVRAIVDEVHQWVNFKAIKTWQYELDPINTNDNTSVSLYIP